MNEQEVARLNRLIREAKRMAIKHGRAYRKWNLRRRTIEFELYQIVAPNVTLEINAKDR